MTIQLPFLFNLFLKRHRAIPLYPFIIVKDLLNPSIINHGKLHLMQQKKFFIIGFYFIHIFFYLKGLIRYKKHAIAYLSIPFEKEAYEKAQGKEYYKKLIEGAKNV